MKTYKLLGILIVALALLGTASAQEKVVNQTTCSGVNNQGTANNVWGQSFIFNATAGYVLKNVEFKMINHTAAPYPAGMIARLRLHWNESATNSTVLFTQTMNLNLGAAGGGGVTCSSGTHINASATDLNWVLNNSGNYTFSVELQAESTAQFWSFEDAANPYANGKCYLCGPAAAAGFYSAYDNVFLIWGQAAAASAPFNITANDAVTNVSITTFNASVTNTTGTYWFSTTNGTIITNLSANQLVNVSINASNYFTNSSTNFNTSSSMQANLTQWTAVYAKALAGGTSINNFYLNYTNTSGTFTLTTTTGVVYFPLYNGNWNVTIYNANQGGTNYAMRNATLNATTFFRNYTFYLFTTNSFNFTWRDERNWSIIYTENSTNENIIVELLGDAISYNYSANGTLYVDLLTPQNYIIRYQKTNGVNYGRIRSYYITLTNQSSEDLDLFMLLDGLSSDLTVTIFDQTTLTPVPGAIVYLQRFNVTLNTYTTVAMYATDVAGKAYFDVEQQDELYRFQVDYPWQTSKKLTEPLYIESSAINIYISLSTEVAEAFFNATGIIGSITANTTHMSVNWIDAENRASEYCFYIKQYSRYGPTIVNSTCTTSNSGGINLGGLSADGTYYGVFTATISGSARTIATGWTEIDSDAPNFGRFGILLAAGFFITLAFLSWFHLLAGLFASAGLVFAKYLGLLPIAWGYIISIVIGAIILAAVLKRK